MKFKEIREDTNSDNSKKKKSKKKANNKKKEKFSWKATIIHGSDYVADKAKKTKEMTDELRTQSFASTEMLWRPYALMIADYFNGAYYRNFDYLYNKLNYLNKKEHLTKKDLSQLEVIISLNELKYYVNDSEKDKTININLELINRDFFISTHEEGFYQELVEESDKKYHYSISYLIKTYNLLISFVKEKELREVFYKTVVLKEKKELREDNHPVVLNEKLIAILPVHDYLSNKYNKKVAYKYDN